MYFDFKELKSKVGVIDIAFALGYKIDRKAGVGRFVEMKSEDGRDKIVVSFPNDRGRQTYFRRDGSRGDVMDLIKEKLDTFNTIGRTDLEKIGNVMKQYANLPIEMTPDREYIANSKTPRVFDAARYNTKPVNGLAATPIFKTRGFTEETVAAFSPFIKLVRDTENEKFKGYNVGFPYTEGGNGDVCGYEIRGNNGYKLKAAGTNSSTGAWVADFAREKGGAPSDIYIFESAFDAMAYHQANAKKDFSNCALVSIGGTFSDGQIRKLIENNPHAQLCDCFDNDRAGRIYGLRLLALVNNMPVKISVKDEGLKVEWGSQIIDVPERYISNLTTFVAQSAKPGRSVLKDTAPSSFKDWNDCILGKKMTEDIPVTKYQRNQNLEERRKGGLKL